MSLLPRPRRLLRAVAPTAAAVAITAVGFAAFTDDASNDGNRATAASVTITEDVAASSRLFDLANWKPGEGAVARCIGVTNDGSIPLPLSLRLDGAPTGSLGDFIDMTIERGTRDAATDTADCATFDADGVVYDGELDEFPTTAATAKSDGGGALGVKAERAYRVTWTLQDSEAAEGLAVENVDFLWETTTAQ